MEIGLTAKVKPDVDERSTERQASALEGRMQEAVEDLEAEVEMDDVFDRVEQMDEHTERLSGHTSDVADSVERASSAMDNFDMGALEDMDADVFDQTVGGSRGVTDTEGGGAGMTDGLEDQKDLLADMGETLNEQKVFFGKRLAQASSIRGILGGLGRMFTKRGGKVALAGIGLIMLSRMVKKIGDASPMLGAVMDMFNLALRLFFMPFGNIMGRLLMPLVGGMLQLAADFNRFMFDIFEDGIMNGVMTLAALTRDSLFDLENLTRIGQLLALIPLLRRFSVQGLANLLIGPFRNLAGRMISAMGLRGLGQQILGRFGLQALFSGLGGRLVGFIPVIGQVIAAIDLLTMAITALIPGVETFSPLMYVLRGGFNLLMSGIDMVVSGFEWFHGIITGITLESIMAGGAGFLDGMLDHLSSIWNWILSVFDPVAGIMAFVFGLLGIFAARAIDFYETIEDGWEFVVDTFELMADWFEDPHIPFDTGDIPLFEGIEERFEDAGDLIDSGGEFVENRFEDAGNFVEAGGDFVEERLEGAGELISSGGDFIEERFEDAGDLVESGGEFAEDRFEDAGDLIESGGEFAEDRLEDAGSFIESGGERVRSRLEDVGSSVQSAGSRLRSRLEDVGSRVRSAGNTLRSRLEDVGSSVRSTGNTLKSRISGVASSVRSVGSTLKSRLEDLVGWIKEKGENLRDAISNLASFITDSDNWPSISPSELLDEISFRSVPGWRIVDAIDWPSLSDYNPFSNDDDGGSGGVVSDTVDSARDLVSGDDDSGTSGGRNGSSGVSSGGGGHRHASPARMASGGLLEGDGLLFGHTGELVLPESQVSRRGRASFDPNSISKGMEMALSETSIPSPSTSDVDLKLDIDTSNSDADDIAAAIEEELRGTLSDVERSIEDLAREISRLDTDRPIQITADGKVIAEVDSRGKDKYKRSRDITK